MERTLKIFAVVLLCVASARAEGLRLGAGQPVFAVPQERAPAPSSELTLEAWVKADKMPTAGGRILDRHIPNGGKGYMLDTYPGNSLRMLTSGGSVRFDAKLPADRWTHVVGVYSTKAKVLNLYVDGVEVASGNCRFAPIENVPAPLTVGRGPNGNDIFSGWIKRAAVYDRALTLREIIKRSGALDPQPLPGVLGEWVFPEKPDDKIESVAGSLVLERLP